MRIGKMLRFALRPLRARAAALTIAAALAMLSIGALAHALVHDSLANEAPCAVCLAADHLGKTATAGASASPVPSQTFWHRTVLPGFTPHPSRRPYASRAPPLA